MRLFKLHNIFKKWGFMLKNKWLMLMILSFGSFYLKPADNHLKNIFLYDETNNIQKLLDINAYPKITDVSSMLLLQTAILRNHTTTLKTLLEGGINPDLTDGLNQTPLHLATKLDKPDMVKILLDAGANPNIADNSGKTPLHMSKDATITKMLLDHNADSTQTDFKNKTPLEYQIQEQIKLKNFDRVPEGDEYFKYQQTPEAQKLRNSPFFQNLKYLLEQQHLNEKELRIQKKKLGKNVANKIDILYMPKYAHEIKRQLKI